MDIEKKKGLIEGALRTGFQLEFRVASIFADFGCDVDSNVLLPPATKNHMVMDSMTEIDVLATRPGGMRVDPETKYVVECKGAEASNALVLTEAPEYEEREPVFHFNKESFYLSDRCILPNPTTGTLVTHSGDFFSENRNQGCWAPVSKQIERSNLYKGNQQLMDAVSGLFEEHVKGDYSQESCEIVPMIVTNCDVCVIRYKHPRSRTLLEQPKLFKLPWVLHRNSLSFSDGTAIGGVRKWTHSGGSYLSKLAEEKRMPYIWIVQLDELQRFVETSGAHYGPEIVAEITEPN